MPFLTTSTLARSVIEVRRASRASHSCELAEPTGGVELAVVVAAVVVAAVVVALTVVDEDVVAAAAGGDEEEGT